MSQSTKLSGRPSALTAIIAGGGGGGGYSGTPGNVAGAGGAGGSSGMSNHVSYSVSMDPEEVNKIVMEGKAGEVITDLARRMKELELVVWKMGKRLDEEGK